MLLYVRREDELENRGWCCAVARMSREVVFEDTVVKEADDGEAALATTREIEAGVALVATCRQSMRCMEAAIGAIGDVCVVWPVPRLDAG